MEQLVGPVLGILLLTVVMSAGVANILGGDAWSTAVMRFYMRIVRWIFGWPFILLGRAIAALGKAIKGK